METQKTIVAWAIETFGDLGTLPKLAARMNTEVAEVLREIVSEPMDPFKVALECADVAIILFRICEITDIDLREKVPGLPDMGWIEEPGAWERAALLLQGCAALASSVPHGDDPIPFQADWFAREVTGIGRMLEDLSNFVGVPLNMAIDRKMQINRARKWVQGKDGSDHWVRVSDPADPPIPNDEAISRWIDGEGRIPPDMSEQDIVDRLKNVPSLLHLSLEDWAEQQGKVRRDAITEILRLRSQVAALEAIAAPRSQEAARHAAASDKCHAGVEKALELAAHALCGELGPCNCGVRCRAGEAARAAILAFHTMMPDEDPLIAWFPSRIVEELSK